MTSWTFFSWMFQQIIPPVLAVVQQIISALSGYVAPVLLAAITAYAAGRLIMLALSPTQEPIGVFVRTLLKCAIAYWIVASAATYNQYLGTLLLTTLPTEITHVVSGASGLVGLVGQVFDDIWGKAWSAGLAVYRNIPSYSFKGIGLQLAVVFYWFVALIAIAIGFVIFVIAQMFTAILVAVGILFAALFPFTASRAYFDRWLSAALTMILLQVFVVVVLTLLVQAENQMIQQLAMNNGTFTAGDEIAQLQTLMGGVLLFILTGFIAFRLPALAAAVAGGVVADVAAFAAAAYTAGVSVGGMLSGAAIGATSAAVASGSSSVDAIAAMTPTGPSLSGTP
jgi:type IV secretory pathway VirB6-like protein